MFSSDTSKEGNKNPQRNFLRTALGFIFSQPEGSLSRSASATLADPKDLLPDETWCHIFSFLSIGDLVKLLMVNQYFSAIAKTVKDELEKDEKQCANLYFFDKMKRFQSKQQKIGLSAVKWLPAFFNHKEPAAKNLDITKDLFNLVDNSHSLLSLTDGYVIKNVFAAAYAEVIAYPSNSNSVKDLLIYFCANALRARDYCASEQTKTALTNFVAKLIAKLELDKYISTNKERKLRLSMLKDRVGNAELKRAATEFSQQQKAGLYQYELISFIKSHGENGLVSLFSDDVLATPGLDQEKFIAGMVQLCALVGTPAVLHACLEEIVQKLKYKDVAECFYEQCKKISQNKYDNLIVKVILEGFSHKNSEELLYDYDTRRKLCNSCHSPLVEIVYNLETHNRLKMLQYLFSEIFFKHETWGQEVTSYLTAICDRFSVDLESFVEAIASDKLSFKDVLLKFERNIGSEEVNEEIQKVIEYLFLGYFFVDYKDKGLLTEDEPAEQARSECRK